MFNQLYIGIAILIKSTSATGVPSFSVEHFSNCAQFLNAPFVFVLPPVTAISPVTKIYASE